MQSVDFSHNVRGLPTGRPSVWVLSRAKSAAGSEGIRAQQENDGSIQGERYP